MTTISRYLTAAAALLTLAAFTGCQDTPATKSADKASTTGTAGTKEAADKPAEQPKLTEADRTAVAKQKVCPVTGQKLGSMGEPYKMTVKGRTIFLCCDGCKDDVEKDPDKYLKKVDELLAAKK